MAKTYLVVAAMQEEIDGLFINRGSVETIGNGIYLHKENDTTVIAMLGGIGKVSMAFKLGQLLNSFIVDEIINVGVAGSISKELQPFDTLVATKCAYHDVDATAFGYEKGQMCQMPLYYVCDEEGVKKAMRKQLNVKTGLILSGDSFITKDNLPSSFFEDFDSPVACDMESAAVGQVANLAHLPFMIIRTISDDTTNQSESNKREYERNLNKAAQRAGDIVWSIINE